MTNINSPTNFSTKYLPKTQKNRNSFTSNTENVENYANKPPLTGHVLSRAARKKKSDSSGHRRSGCVRLTSLSCVRTRMVSSFDDLVAHNFWNASFIFKMFKANVYFF